MAGGMAAAGLFLPSPPQPIAAADDGFMGILTLIDDGTYRQHYLGVNRLMFQGGRGFGKTRLIHELTRQALLEGKRAAIAYPSGVEFPTLEDVTWPSADRNPKSNLSPWARRPRPES